MNFSTVVVVLCLFTLVAVVFCVRWIVKQSRNPTISDLGKDTHDWMKIKYMRHDGVERDEHTHQHLLRSNSLYRAEADGKPVMSPSASLPSPNWQFQITYQDKDGKLTVRRIKNVEVSSEKNPMITAFCEVAGAERNFRASRVLSCVNLESGRAIKDFGAYLKRGYGSL